MLVAMVQRLSEIRNLLRQAGSEPHRRMGQHFLIDPNLMRKLIDLAELSGEQTVLEAGAGTGSLTEELLARAARVVAVELDPKLSRLLERRLGGDPKLTLIVGDVLAGKQNLSPRVLTAVGESAHVVSNLPYSLATPLVAECLLSSWRAVRGAGQACRFDRLTFTVQREVADRLAASEGRKTYGPVSVLVALLGRIRSAATLPPEAFWPRPGVVSRMVRIDFDAGRAEALTDADLLVEILRLAFQQRRKQIGSLLGRKDVPFTREALARALTAADIDKTRRPEQLSPAAYRTLAKTLAERAGPRRPGARGGG